MDLKWSRWSATQAVWEDYAPGVWAQLETAFKGESDPVQVTSTPRKLFGQGIVTIGEGRAKGHFYTQWDDYEALANTLGVTNDEAFRECIPSTTYGETGMACNFAFKARSFQSLMKRVDNEEAKLLEMDAREWAFIEEMFKHDRNDENGVSRSRV